MSLQCAVDYSEIQHGSKIIALDDHKFSVLLSNKEARVRLGGYNSHEQQCNSIQISFDVQNIVLMLCVTRNCHGNKKSKTKITTTQ